MATAVRNKWSGVGERRCWETRQRRRPPREDRATPRRFPLIARPGCNIRRWATSRGWKTARRARRAPRPFPREGRGTLRPERVVPIFQSRGRPHEGFVAGRWSRASPLTCERDSIIDHGDPRRRNGEACTPRECSRKERRGIRLRGAGSGLRETVPVR